MGTFFRVFGWGSSGRKRDATPDFQCRCARSGRAGVLAGRAQAQRRSGRPLRPQPDCDATCAPSHTRPTPDRLDDHRAALAPGLCAGSRARCTGARVRRAGPCHDLFADERQQRAFDSDDGPARL